MTPLFGKKMSDYSSSIWGNFGHPAFANEEEMAIENIEWWDTEKEKE